MFKELDVTGTLRLYYFLKAAPLWSRCLPPGRFQVHYRVQSPGKAKRPSCKRKSCSSAEVDAKLHRHSSDVGRPRDRGMANKENELTCSDDVRGVRCYDSYRPPVNSAEASKMAGASSKYSDFAEVGGGCCSTLACFPVPRRLS